jgi:hypothetical protein
MAKLGRGNAARTGKLRRAIVLALALLFATASLPGYYHFLYYPSRFGPFVPIPLRFDLGAIPNRTVPFFISEQGPSPLAPGDTFAAWLSQIRLAARVWNDVETSDLRLRFGGITNPDQMMNGPGIDIVFEELPPAVLAQGGPITVAEVQYLANGAAYVPIVRSKLQLARDLSQYPSWGEAYFLTLVHEFGHALGLQHTLTSSVMSTAITRGTSKAKPITADDIAGISALYPARSFATLTGVIQGRVLVNNRDGVNVASVVAINEAGISVSALTNPDGSYRMEGVPPGNYWIYAHPLPPAFAGEVTPANIVLPKDPSQGFFEAGTAFDTQFFPNTRDWTRASTVRVSVGSTVENINFNVVRRASPAMHSVQTYGFTGRVAIKAPYFRPGSRSMLVFTGTGLVAANNNPVAGLTVSVLGGGASVVTGSLRAYSSPPYLQVDIDVPLGAAEGPRHLVFSTASDIYVLPLAFHVAANPAPELTTLTPGFDETGNRVLSVAGANLTADTRLLFDGVPANLVRRIADMLLFTVPAGPGSHRAGIVALNPDGQSSAQPLGNALPPQYIYDPAENPWFSVSPSALPAGVDAMVEITGFNTNFQTGQTVVGFGSSEVTVRRVWVQSTNRLLVNVSVSPNAATGAISLVVVSGLQSVQQADALRITAASPTQATLRVPIVSAVTNLEGVPPGGTALLTVQGANSSTNGWTLTVGNQTVPMTPVNQGNFSFQVPFGLTAGPAVVRLTVPNVEAVPPVVMQVDAPPPVISQARFESGVAIEAASPARPGDWVTLVVMGLWDAPQPLPRSSIRLNVGGWDFPIQSIVPGAQPGSWLVTFRMANGQFSGSTVPVVVRQDTRVSAPFSLPVQN